MLKIRLYGGKEFAAMMKLGDEYECSRKQSSTRKCFHNSDMSVKGRRRGC